MGSGGQNKIDLMGQVFGGLTVIGEAPASPRGLANWVCTCECGNEYVTSGYYLRQGRKRSCGCRNGRLRGKDNPKWSGHEDISGSFWNSIRSGAKQRKLKLEITIQDAWKLFLEQDGKCALTGLEIVLCASDIERREKEIEQTASLDRIDSTLGYIHGNVQWVHKDVNKIKQNLTQARFIELCRLIAEHNNE